VKAKAGSVMRWYVQGDGCVRKIFLMHFHHQIKQLLFPNNFSWH